MKWHFMTSGKGGVGKTLISLMLLTYFLRRRTHTLIFDMNFMNPDIRGILLDFDRISSPKLLSNHTHGFDIRLVKQTIDDHDFYIGWNSDTYSPIAGDKFPVFLSWLKEEMTKLNVDVIILDTNYHFCNLFSKNSAYYTDAPIFNNDHEDLYFVWFIWVYRQLSHMTGQEQDGWMTERQLVSETARKMETHLKNARETPFVHVMNSLSTLDIKLKGGFSDGLRATAEKLFNHGNYEFQNLIPPAGLDTLPALKFADFLDSAKKSMRKVIRQGCSSTENIHPYFVDVMADLLTKGRPANFFTLPTVESSFTDLSDVRASYIGSGKNKGLYNILSKKDIFKRFEQSMREMSDY